MSATPVKLSFCIPVYNFGEFIEETLDSIAANAHVGLSYEVLVLDGGSSDQTPLLMEAYTQKMPQLRYVRKAKKGGIDADLNLAVRQAKGEYCWLLSGDDTLRSGVIEKLMGFLSQAPDVFLCEHTQCDLKLNFLYDYPIFTARMQNTVDFADATSRRRYLAAAKNTEACFSFMSGIVVRRATWLSVEPPAEFQGSCWWHVARFFECAKQSLLVCYVGESWVNRRGGNDSFLDQGLVRRLSITVDGYQDMVDHYYGFDSIEALHVRRLVRADIRLRHFLYAKLMAYEAPVIESRIELDRLVRRAYSDRTLSCILSKLVYFLTPVIALSFARTIRLRIQGFLCGVKG